MNRGQITGQVFIYILTAVIVGLILLFGIKAVLKILKTGEEVELVEFKINFEKRLEKDMQHGVVDDKPVEIRGGFKEVCFVQLKDDLGGYTTPPLALRNSYPLIWNSWNDKVDENIFFVKEEMKDSMYVKNLKVRDPNNYVCLSVTSGIVSNVRFIGQGNGVLVEQI